MRTRRCGWEPACGGWSPWPPPPLCPTGPPARLRRPRRLPGHPGDSDQMVPQEPRAWPAPPPGWGCAASWPWPDTPGAGGSGRPGRGGGQLSCHSVPLHLERARHRAPASRHTSGAIQGDRPRIAQCDAARSFPTQAGSAPCLTPEGRPGGTPAPHHPCRKWLGVPSAFCLRAPPAPPLGLGPGPPAPPAVTPALAILSRRDLCAGALTWMSQSCRPGHLAPRQAPRLPHAGICRLPALLLRGRGHLPVCRRPLGFQA